MKEQKGGGETRKVMEHPLSMSQTVGSAPAALGSLPQWHSLLFLPRGQHESKF